MASKTIPKVQPDSWLMGSVKSYMEDPLGFLMGNAQLHGDIYQFRTAHKVINVINRPEYVQHILQKNQRNYKRHFAYEVLKLLVGNGVLTSDGEKWKKARRMMQPQFHKKNIESYFDTISTSAARMVTSWETRDQVWLLSEMTQITLDIITSCFLGGSVPNSAEIIEKNLPFALEIILERIQSPIQPPVWVPTPKNRKFKTCVRNLETLVNQIIAEKEKNENFHGNDLITMYLLLEREGETVSKQQIFDEVITILNAGHETTANAMFSLVKHVLEHPDVLEKVQAEFKKVTQGGPIKLEHLSALTYTNKVINESLRLSTPVWTIGREVIADDVMDGYTLKKGHSIVVSPYLIHRNPDLWPNPEKFDPDRFDNDPVHKYAYFPFGGGPKLCIGMGLALMEMQVILYHILQSDFDLEASAFEKMEFHTSLTLRPKKDIRLLKSIPQETSTLETVE